MKIKSVRNFLYFCNVFLKMQTGFIKSVKRAWEYSKQIGEMFAVMNTPYNRVERKIDNALYELENK